LLIRRIILLTALFSFVLVVGIGCGPSNPQLPAGSSAPTIKKAAGEGANIEKKGVSD
jgi:hypothetical protein